MSIYNLNQPVVCDTCSISPDQESEQLPFVTEFVQFLSRSPPTIKNEVKCFVTNKQNTVLHTDKNTTCTRIDALPGLLSCVSEETNRYDSTKKSWIETFRTTGSKVFPLDGSRPYISHPPGVWLRQNDTWICSNEKL